MMEFIAGFPLAKIIYSGILAAVVVVFGQEIHRVWFDTRAYITVSNYFSDGKSDAARATAFGEHVLAQHHRMVFDLRTEKPRDDTVGDQAQVLPLTLDNQSVGVQAPAQKLEMKIQGFDIGALLEKLRAWVSPVNEVSATVEARAFGKPEAKVIAAVSWPQAPDGDPANPSTLRFFSTSALERDEEVAAEIAANFVWAALTKESQKIQHVPRDEFVAWLLAWQRYRDIRSLKLPPAQLSDVNKASLERAGAQIRPFLGKELHFAEVWRLAANLTVQHPQSIPGDARTWEDFRDQYKLAVDKTAPSRPSLNAQRVDTSTQKTPENPVLWRADGRIAVKVTAVLRDSAGKRYLLVPAHLAREVTLPFDLFGETGQNKVPLARAVRTLNWPAGTSSPTLMIAELLPNVVLGVQKPVGLGPSPAIEEKVTVAGSGREGKVEGVDVTLANMGSAFIKVVPQITLAGDAGVPILNASGQLVAMGYAGSGTSSWIVPLEEALKQEGLTLAP